MTAEARVVPSGWRAMADAPRDGRKIIVADKHENAETIWWDCKEYDGRARGWIAKSGYPIDCVESAFIGWVPSPASPPAETGEAVAWRSGDHAPSITHGTAKTFVVTIFRAHTNQNHTFAAEYLNAMELEWDEYGDTRMATKTGWFLEVGEDQDFYRPLTLGEGDKFLGWTDLPVFGAATHPASDQSDTERTNG